MELPLQDSEVERFLKVNESKDIFEKFGETDKKIEIEIAGNLYLIQHEEKKTFKCTLCDAYFSLKTNLSKHIKSVHEKKKPFNCIICDANFASKQSMKSHSKSVHEGEKPFKCNICDSIFARNHHLKRHVEYVHEKKNPLKLDIKSEIDENTRNSIMENSNIENMLLSDSEAIVIPKEEKFELDESSDDNFVEVHESKKEKVGALDVKSELLQSELEIGKDPIDVSLNSNKKRYKCNICDANFASKQGMNFHVESFHNGQKPFKCNICDSIFTRKQSMKKHVEAVHEGKKPFKCNICDYSFAQK